MIPEVTIMIGMRLWGLVPPAEMVFQNNFGRKDKPLPHVLISPQESI